ncbi:MAG: nuclease-related domain-containing protein [Anaerolineaceae bacterium]|nr:nuclease-related domain-containing protein [Anaerolineaceae bacterium]
MTPLPSEMTEAIRLYREGSTEQSRALLRDYICNADNQYDALLWLAKVTPNDAEAMTAAELAYHLDPENEIAQRAVVAVRSRTEQKPGWDPKFEVISFTGMTVAQARSVNWPFRGHQRPIGVLLDEKCIGMNDLGWAAQNSYDEYIKTAARTLLLTYLLEEKADTSKQPVKVVQGVDHAGFIERWASFQGGIIVAGIFGLSLIILVSFCLSTFFHLYAGWITNLVSLVAFLITILLYFLSDRLVETINQAKKGREGEGKVLDQLRAILHSPWAIFHNLSWQNRKWGDVDFVLVGPGGMWVFEVKAYSRMVRVMGDLWQYKSRWGWRKLSKDPGLQARRNAVRVKEYLNANGVNVGWVQAVVIWAGEDSQIVAQDPTVPVWKVAEIQDRVEEFWRQQKLSGEQIGKVDEILVNLVQVNAQRTTV